MQHHIVLIHYWISVVAGHKSKKTNQWGKIMENTLPKNLENRLTKEMVDLYTMQGYWGKKTIFDLLKEQAKKNPDKIAIVDSRRHVTYSELYENILRSAALFKKHGIEKGDVITIQLPNWIEFVYIFFSLELIGAIANKISPDFRFKEIEFILKFSESRAFICPAIFKDFNYEKMADDLQNDIPQIKNVFVIDSPVQKNFVDFNAELHLTTAISENEMQRIDANSIYRMAFTSGTTGNPKNVLHSANTTLSACHFLARDMQCTKNDVYLIYLPIGLNWGYLVLVQALISGAKVALLDRFSGKTALEWIDREKVTFIPTAPASIIAMLNVPELNEFDVSSLRVVITGGASCPVETLRSFQKEMSGKLIELYGMLEDGYHTYTSFDDDPEKVNGTIGKCVKGMGLKLLNESNEEVAFGEEGEIAAYGPSVHLGYNKNPEANAESFTKDGWFRTGDLGVFADNDKNVRISGRSKEIINRGGKKFYPREVEEILYTHPSIIHAAIVGIPDARLGERNCLCVILKPGKSLTLDDCIDFLKGEVATYKLPEFFEIVENLPFTPTGKLQRFVLAKQMSEKLGLIS